MMSAFSHEIKALLSLALPVSLAQLALVGMSATDVLIAGNASTVDLAGMNLGANSWNMIVMFFMGIGFATQPLVAKSFGANNLGKVKHQLHQSIWLCLALGIIAMLAVWCLAWLFALIGYEPEMLSIAREYLYVIGLAAIPATLISAVRGALEGMSQTRSVLWINLAVFLVNIPLDYMLVNGLYGFPRLGGVGCAWATVCLIWCMFMAYVGILVWHKHLEGLKFFANFEPPHREAILNTLKVGFPIGVSILIELSMFSGAGMMIAYLGPVQASAHAVAITISYASFVLYMGLAQGVTIRASQFLGAENPQAAWYTVKTGTAFNIMIACMVCVAFLLFTEPLVRLFSSDPEVVGIAIVLLYFGAAFQIADCLQVGVICALRAYHDTSSPPKYQFVAFWIFGLPLGAGLAFFGWWPGLEGAKGFWFGLVASLFLVGILLSNRLMTKVREEELSGAQKIVL